MDKKNFLIILALSLIALAVAILAPGGRDPDPNPKLPWDVQVDAQGNSQVFGITLGQTTLKQVQDLLQEEGTINLFRSPAGVFSVEAYFQRIYLSGLRADFVLTLAVDEADAEAMFKRGLRISELGSGTQKITLSEADERVLGGTPVEHLTYLPAANLPPELLASRFGEPARRTPDGDVVHWLYPEKGLDIIYSPNGDEVLQYVSPARFDELMAPLIETR